MCYVNKVHSEWITQIKYDDDLNAIVTSSMDGTVKLSDRADLLRSKSNCVRHVFEGHKCGVLGFAWSEMFRVMVSIGVERGPLAWNPFTKSTVITLDAGH